MNGALVAHDDLLATAESIAKVQLGDGMIPWFQDGHADPWNHVEAAMALSLCGRSDEAERAYRWLATKQHIDGSWCTYYLDGGVEEPRRDPNVCAYVAAGAWHHFLVTDDRAFLEWAWPMVRGAIDFVLSLQRPGGEITWSLDPDGTRGRFALLTSSSSIHHSLRCAIAIAQHLGHERPDWEVAVGRVRHAVAHRPEAFEPKDRWAMDWYYPVLSGAVTEQEARYRMAERKEGFVLAERGVRCVSDQPWVTTAETAECAMAFDAAGQPELGAELMTWIAAHRYDDGSYWTGCVYPDGVYFPGGERTTYSSAAVILATFALDGDGPACGLFRGDGLPTGIDLELEPVTTR